MNKWWARLRRDKLALCLIVAAIICVSMAVKEYANANESKRQITAYLQKDVVVTQTAEETEEGTEDEEPNASAAPVTVVDSVYSPPKFEGIVPATIEIPAIKLQPSEVIKVGVLPGGEMGVPEDWHTAGWFESGYLPGEPGNAVMSGHVDNREGLGIFFFLKSLQVGDQVVVADETGKKLTFAVKKLEIYLPEEAPLEQIFGESTVPRLNLITCTGTFSAKTLSYDKRLVVYTELVT
ncbi:class F sortase [Paenibacillus allorhizosphaerae]|uniref:Class F sortase n=1 Tax=Paenibacillus allorhizosphaerae TaxID=2849866 RepID=A0ABN7TEI1_9BACL|nr:class F sortase [Paenibacillus allorhizosphaerae]CAG7626892.1 hypothetical protein PAECIP111802_01297 [Paenibacillus allorhizosphaerae]